MARLLASYRWRRRALWLTLLAIGAASVAAIAIEFPDRHKPEPQASGPRIKLATDKTPKTVALKPGERAHALAVADVFVHTAVARKHLERAWPLLSPEIKQGMTRQAFLSGNNPVIPYPVGQIRYALDYSYARRVGFQIAIFPTHGAHVKPQVFLLDLREVGSRLNGHWLVKAWNPTPYPNITGGPTPGGSLLDRTSAHAPGDGGGRLSVAWLLLPVGLLSLVILIPIGLMLTHWRKGRAIERDYLRDQGARG